MFEFVGSPVPVRDDIKEAHRAIWAHLSRPGQVFDAHQRRAILEVARSSNPEPGDPVQLLGDTLYACPPDVTHNMVEEAVTAAGEPAVVETVALIAMLAAVDNTHRALGVDLEPLPDPTGGDPSGEIAAGLRKRRTHVPMPRHSITVALELLPRENEAYAASCGPLYMTFDEMASPIFGRSPGLNRAQLETIAARTSLINECFY